MQAASWDRGGCPGVLRVLFNSLEECCEACPRWDVVEKQVSAISTNRSYKEIVVSVMMNHATPQQRRRVQGYHGELLSGELLSWRWESLRVTLGLEHYPAISHRRLQALQRFRARVHSQMQHGSQQLNIRLPARCEFQSVGGPRISRFHQEGVCLSSASVDGSCIQSQE